MAFHSPYNVYQCPHFQSKPEVASCSLGRTDMFSEEFHITKPWDLQVSHAWSLTSPRCPEPPCTGPPDCSSNQPGPGASSKTGIDFYKKKPSIISFICLFFHFIWCLYILSSEILKSTANAIMQSAEDRKIGFPRSLEN